jgi:AcrR family transcriptional regulator
MKSRKSAKAPQKRNADATRAKILQAALSEFSERGLRAASTDHIAEHCGVNKRMIYYYFGSKEGLYLAALESVFENLVAREREVQIDHLEPRAAIEAMINLKIDYYLENPHFVSFLSMENFYKARHLRKSKKLATFKAPLTDVISRILKRGQRGGYFRQDVEPVDFYVSMCALCIMYFSNQHTFGAIFGREMMTPANIERRRRTVIDFVLRYLQMPNDIQMPSTRRRSFVSHLSNTPPPPLSVVPTRSTGNRVRVTPPAKEGQS